MGSRVSEGIPHNVSNFRRHRAGTAAGWLLILIGCAIPAYGDTQEMYDFTECIVDSGAVFFGAHWCRSCEKQKARFGEVAFMLPKSKQA